QLELSRKLDWKIAGLLALEDAVHVACRTTVVVCEINPIGCKPTVRDVRTLPIDRRQAVPGGERDDLLAMTNDRRGTRRDQASIGLVRQGFDRAVDLAGIAHGDGRHLDPERP